MTGAWVEKGETIRRDTDRPSVCRAGGTVRGRVHRGRTGITRGVRSVCGAHGRHRELAGQELDDRFYALHSEGRRCAPWGSGASGLMAAPAAAAPGRGRRSRRRPLRPCAA